MNTLNTVNSFMNGIFLIMQFRLPKNKPKNLSKSLQRQMFENKRNKTQRIVTSKTSFNYTSLRPSTTEVCRLKQKIQVRNGPNKDVDRSFSPESGFTGKPFSPMLRILPCKTFPGIKLFPDLTSTVSVPCSSSSSSRTYRLRWHMLNTIASRTRYRNYTEKNGKDLVNKNVCFKLSFERWQRG